MNYYEHHIGDYAEATSHLSILEDGIYSRLLRRYYATEEPLPTDQCAIARYVRANTKHERAALEAVLLEFFVLQDDGWHQERCDAEIEALRERLVGKVAATQNAKARQRLSRERRKQLFEQLRALGHVPAFSTTNAGLAAMLRQAQQAQSVVSRVTALNTERDETASPDPTVHTPVSKLQQKDGGAESKLFPGFQRFWDEWPKGKRKEARGKCEKAWSDGAYEGLAEQIISHITAKLSYTDWAKEDGNYVEAPLVYLSQRRWEGAEVEPRRNAHRQQGSLGKHIGLQQLDHRKGIAADGSLA